MEFPGIRGFSSQNLWLMQQFYLAHSSPEFLSRAVRELRIKRGGEKLSQAVAAKKTNTNPIGVVEYQLQPTLPARLKGRLPSPRQLVAVVREAFPART